MLTDGSLASVEAIPCLISSNEQTLEATRGNQNQGRLPKRDSHGTVVATDGGRAPLAARDHRTQWVG